MLNLMPLCTNKRGGGNLSPLLLGIRHNSFCVKFLLNIYQVQILCYWNITVNKTKTILSLYVL